MTTIKVPVDLNQRLRLDAFLKIIGIAPTGGIAKQMVIQGDVKVNGDVETRRGRQLRGGDRVSVEGIDDVFQVQEED